MLAQKARSTVRPSGWDTARDSDSCSCRSYRAGKSSRLGEGERGVAPRRSLHF